MTHQQIAALVRAPDKKTAKEDAEEVFDKVIGHAHSYDYYHIEDAYPYDSEKGKSALQRIFGAQTLEFNDHLAVVRKAFAEAPAKSDEELMEDHMLRFHFFCVGMDDGWVIRVFDPDAVGVEDRGHLKNVIEDWPSLVESGQHVKSRYPLWVVTADGHH